MSSLQAILIAILQGATELFPVSSLGHAVLLPALAGWDIDQHGATFLPFLVFLHLGTAAALLIFFGRDWWTIASGTVGLGGAHQVAESRRVLLLIIVATIPAVIAGGLLEHLLRSLFAAPAIVAGFLIVNAAMLLAGERLRARQRVAAVGAGFQAGARKLSTLRAMDALVIGLWQCLALLPGISRSGSTIVGALLRGVDHEGAAHFSFLIALPVILGATVLEVPKLLHADVPAGVFEQAAAAAVVAGVTAFASTWFLMRWFRNHDDWALDPFAWYCAALGAISLVVLLVA
jgi:undecaprenyl-diphosphatase